MRLVRINSAQIHHHFEVEIPAFSIRSIGAATLASAGGTGRFSQLEAHGVTTELMLQKYINKLKIALQ